MTNEPEIRTAPEAESETVTAKQRAKNILQVVMAWIVIASLWVADQLIWVMLRTRTDERRIRPTERVAWPKGLKQELMRRQNNTCVYCGHRRTARTLEIDHIVPVVRGGSNDKSNLQVICGQCNQRKGLQTDEEFRDRYSSLVPKRRLTAPRRRISQDEFKAATQRTSQSDTVREFRRTRFISRREKVVGGCVGLAIGAAIVTFFVLAYMGIEDNLLLLPPVVLGAALGSSIWLRAYKTGAMIEEE